ncbi:MAG: hypothetical protein HC849_10790 [Oscillatoriales cyanobacterium RU_3_3]|nr:hypothetical protein [Microcoleus sp. SU_5_6]NJM60569.1 hypothetical protein [Oscillatoriales cyanobacterium RU_3_3]NJR26646.1 hypothetical protein [Richelia sp. CSU_2_1]
MAINLRLARNLYTRIKAGLSGRGFNPPLSCAQLFGKGYTRSKITNYQLPITNYRPPWCTSYY